jgi:glutamate-1-semialdehyde 2,1-aminomutase
MFERSQDAFQRAQLAIPGGVNSPARAFKSVGGTPLFFQSAKGAVLHDIDGNEYTDYVGSWGPMIMGHAYEPVVEAVQRAAAHSTSFGAPTQVETEMAEQIKAMAPGVERVRMVNSGTEACMSAIRLARGYTGRHKVMKFAGNYHGHGDSFLIQAGSSALTMGEPSSPGVTPGTAKDTVIARYNDLEHVRQLFQEYGNELAAVIVEPIAGNMGCVPPVEGFLEELRRLSTEYGTVLIFDEVMCGFRVAPGGAAELYGITPDLYTFGKIVGAGMPVGAFAGQKDLMETVAPTGPVSQGGTLSGNPLAMHAGLTLLRELANTPSIYERLETLGDRLESGLRGVLAETNLPWQINRVGSMLSVFFSQQPVRDFDTAVQVDKARFGRFFHALLRRGVYLPPSPWESFFLAAVLTDAQVDHTVQAAREALQAEQAGVGV